MVSRQTMRLALAGALLVIMSPFTLDRGVSPLLGMARGHAIDPSCTTTGLSISMTAELTVSGGTEAEAGHDGDVIVYSVTEVSLPSDTDCPVTDGYVRIVSPDGVVTPIAAAVALGGAEPRSKSIGPNVRYVANHSDEVDVAGRVWRAAAIIDATRHMSNGADGPASVYTTWDTIALHPALQMAVNCTSHVSPSGIVAVHANVTNTGDTLLTMTVEGDRAEVMVGPSSIEPGQSGLYVGDYLAPFDAAQVVDTVTATGVDWLGGTTGTVEDTYVCLTEIVPTTTTSLGTSTSTTTSTTSSSSTTTVPATTTTTTTATKPAPSTTSPQVTVSPAATETPAPTSTSQGGASWLDTATVGLMAGVGTAVLAAVLVVLRLRRIGPFAKERTWLYKLRAAEVWLVFWRGFLARGSG